MKTTAIRFERDERPEKRRRSPQRLAAARRAIEKDQERNALTPELVRPYNADIETRLDYFDRRVDFVYHRLRSHRAKCWREGRRMLRDLSPEMQKSCLNLWNREIYPLTGVCFVEHVRRCRDRPVEVLEFLEFLNSRQYRSLESPANSGYQSPMPHE